MIDARSQTSPVSLTLPDEQATEALAASFAPLLCGQQVGVPKGGRIHLRGDLGAGKTSFVRALLRASGIQGRIKSPSYALLESYNLSSLHFYHLDFYRFSDSREWLDAGFRDILQDDSIVLIEWPEQAGELLPPPDLDIQIKHEDEGRSAVLTPYSDKGSLWLTTLFPAKPAPHLPTSQDGA
ncbi:MAG TPA: tRNA (adenosine(37)-N6)-threonylcarbamoyltransferase complex ATPase subunit type 1 TsaE [Burkholderiaceae bacterium]|nr:tRNA (adenosine(37)-N6)-threonylcarbamoyltransferase complex ATPase subunit type 1 TsaE [Burkholderiaceae bacterium]